MKKDDVSTRAVQCYDLLDAVAQLLDTTVRFFTVVRTPPQRACPPKVTDAIEQLDIEVGDGEADTQ